MMCLIIIVASWYVWGQRHHLTNGRARSTGGKNNNLCQALATNFMRATRAKIERKKEDQNG